MKTIEQALTDTETDKDIVRNEDGTISIICNPPVPTLDNFNINFGPGVTDDVYVWRFSTFLETPGGIQVNNWTTQSYQVASGVFSSNPELVAMAEQIRDLAQRMSVLLSPYSTSVT